MGPTNGPIVRGPCWPSSQPSAGWLPSVSPTPCPTGRRSSSSTWVSGVLLVTTHGLGHLAVGKARGMKFTHWFVGTMQRPQPGVKLDYATYLRVDAVGRAWMHASGAIVTKIVPFGPRWCPDRFRSSDVGDLESHRSHRGDDHHRCSLVDQGVGLEEVQT